MTIFEGITLMISFSILIVAVLTLSFTFSQRKK